MAHHGRMIARSSNAAWCAMLLLAFVVVAVMARAGVTGAWDAGLLAHLRVAGAPGTPDLPPRLIEGAVRLTSAGAGIVRAPVAIAVAIILATARQGRAAAALLAGWAGESMGVEAIKAVVRRARPDPAWRLVHAGSFSFPSGHAAGTMLLYPLVGLFLGGMFGRRAAAVGLAVGIVLALAVGMTRIMLGVHWASDVFAGWLFGGAIACLAAIAAPRSGRAG